MRFTEGELDHYAMPSLRAYADFVHLLPGSKNHHHRATGGLLRHGLEVALFAAMSAGGRVFGVHRDAKYRTLVQGRFLFAAFLAGLAHDIGKPISDMEVCARASGQVWNPYLGSLGRWCRETLGDDLYEVKFKPSRKHREHEIFSVLGLQALLTPEAIDYLTAEGQAIELMETVVSVIGGSARLVEGTDAFELACVLRAADRKSVRRDLRGEINVVGTEPDPLPLPQQIVAKILHLYSEEILSANSPSSRLFWCSDRLFINLDQGLADLLRTSFEADGIAIPGGAPEVRTILSDSGIIRPLEGARPLKLRVVAKTGLCHELSVCELETEPFEELISEIDPTPFAIELTAGTTPRPVNNPPREGRSAPVVPGSSPEKAEQASPAENAGKALVGELMAGISGATTPPGDNGELGPTQGDLLTDKKSAPEPPSMGSSQKGKGGKAAKAGKQKAMQAASGSKGREKGQSRDRSKTEQSKGQPDLIQIFRQATQNGNLPDTVDVVVGDDTFLITADPLGLYQHLAELSDLPEFRVRVTIADLLKVEESGIDRVTITLPKGRVKR